MATPFLPMFNLFCHSVDGQLEFYRQLLGLQEIVEASSPIYRVLTDGVLQIGFNGMPAYALMGLEARQRDASVDFAACSMLTFVVQEPGLVDEARRKAEPAGGAVVKGPFATYYGHWQVVIADPEGNVMRLTCPSLPAGTQAPALEA